MYIWFTDIHVTQIVGHESWWSGFTFGLLMYFWFDHDQFFMAILETEHKKSYKFESLIAPTVVFSFQEW